MATKKATKKASEKNPKTAAAANTSNENDVIFACIRSVFDNAGVGNVTKTTKIVWSKFTDPADILNQLADGIRDCINAKSFKCKSLIGIFKNLRAKNKITTGSELIDIIALLVTS